MPYKSRHTEELLRGRVSIPGALYFLTWVTAQRSPLLVLDPNREIARQCIAAIDESGDGSVLAGTVMPDHIHLLLELGARLSISKVAAKTKATITRSCPKMTWQLNFFERRLRSTEAAEGYAFYIFMNPYSAGICPLNLTWPGWVASKTVRWEFEGKLRHGGLPQSEWVPAAQRSGERLPAGAD